MFSNASNRTGLKQGKSALKLSRRQASLERQNDARTDVVDELRPSAEESHEPEMWIDGHFQRVIKRLVHSLIEAENQLYALQERRQQLESCKRDEKVPNGMKISHIAAKGQNVQVLQEKFKAILKEAKLKLLDVTIEALQPAEQLLSDRSKVENQNTSTTIETWRNSFKSSFSSLETEADEFFKSARSFAENFYFQCAATRASKRVSENIKKASREAKKAERMDTTFTITEQSLQDMVQHAVQREMSKLKPAPRKTSNCCRNNRSTSRNRKRQRQSQSNSSPKDKDASQNRRSRPKQRKQSPRKPRVSFSDSQSPSTSRRQQSKNGRGRGKGLVK